MKKLCCIFFLSPIFFPAKAQDSAAAPKIFIIGGYIKSLQSLNFDKNFTNVVSGNLIHNRINIKWKTSASFSAGAEFRNRLFWGENVKHVPDFAAQLRNSNEKINLQKAWIDNKSLVLHTNVERLYFDYRNTEVNFRIGRQRINWGIGTTWNPNDIFNAYNFLDFDYEERPGVDGATFRYLLSSSFNAEIAYAHTGKKDGSVAAIKYSLNQWGYDVQLITGWYNEHITLGGGWAGSIKDAGFKGEAQYFFREKDSSRHFNLSLEGDYMFKKGWYVNVSMLYNNDGLSKPVSNWNSINLKLSPENLMPTRWSFIVTTAKEITTLFSANMSVLFAPGSNLVFLLPSLKYNLAANLDADLIWQSYFAELDKNFEAVTHQCYIRLKWSF